MYLLLKIVIFQPDMLVCWRVFVLDFSRGSIWKSTGACMSLVLEVQLCQSGVLGRFLVYLECYKAGPEPIVINGVKQPLWTVVSKWVSLGFFHPTFWGYSSTYKDRLDTPTL